MEVDIDVGSSSVAATVVNLVQGATKSLVVDMGIVLEGHSPEELPESLLGTVRACPDEASVAGLACTTLDASLLGHRATRSVSLSTPGWHALRLMHCCWGTVRARPAAA